MRALTAGSFLALAAGGMTAHVAEARRRVVRLSGLSGSVRTLLLAAGALDVPHTLVVVADEPTATELREDLDGVLPELAVDSGRTAPVVRVFPSLEADPYQGIGTHPQVLSERAATLGSMLDEQKWIILVPIGALWAPLLPPARFRERTLNLKGGDGVGFDALGERLQSAGYSRVEMATSPGDWARRGGIFDVFPPGDDDPVRVELEDDRVASLRLFDPLTQRSLEIRDEVVIPPARETPLGEEEKQTLIARLEKMPRTGGKSLTTDPLESLALEGTFPGIEACAGLWAGRETDLFHYAPGALLVLDEPFRLEAEMNELPLQLEAAREGAGSVLPKAERMLLPARVLKERLSAPRIELHDLSLGDQELALAMDGAEALSAGEPHDGAPAAHAPPAGKAAAVGDELRVEVAGRAPRAYFGRLDELATDLEQSVKEGRRSLILLQTEGLLERTREMLHERGLQPVTLPATLPERGELPLVSLAQGKMSHGFELPEQKLMVLSERDVFGERRGRKPRAGRGAAAFRSDFRDLKVGDTVVHIDHGIGRYQGIKRFEGEGVEKEFMILVYRDETVLYVPMDRLDLVQRYSGAGAKTPRLDKLGTPGWEKVRTKVRKAMQDIADQLLELYAARRALPGRAFGPDTPWQAELAASFPFEETPDQLQAIQDVTRDMESSRPMDRLLCGDVGFGKTEVAMRAAFKAVMDGAQVAVLAPTTVLAFQHLNTFRDRFAAFPVTVEMLSRFQTRSEQKDVTKRLKEGGIDVVIGTHRLLSKGIVFKDLGLLVVDEEQRFGVAHKERLKQMSVKVDVLTMTATPIPRTLQMSLAGVRDLSVIETPPENRMSIQTLLLPFRPGILGQAVRREIRRGGQVFFVHNRIGSIGAMATVIRREVPGVSLEVAHGQMDEKNLEDVMLRFMAGKFDVLLTTSIIENGLDIPRANTIIVNRAEQFGLSQLYQLRGRVGRSDIRAYSYFLIPSLQKLSDIARRRLKALQEFTELGSGFRVAARDLEIRGAGELLGAKQHGHIAALGFDLYCQMLEAAVQEKRGEAEPMPEVRVTLDLGVDYRLPGDFVADAHQRLILYKKVAAAAEAGELDRVREEIEDRFGHLPSQAENLLLLSSLRQRAEQLGIAQIDARDREVSFHFVEGARIDSAKLLSWLREKPEARLAPSGELTLLVRPDPEERLEDATQFLETLTRVAFTPAA